MLFIYALLAIIESSPETNTYSIEMQGTISGYQATNAIPSATLFHHGDLYVVDTDSQLWVIPEPFGEARHLAQFSVASFLGLYPRGEHLVLLDQAGYRSTVFDRNGRIQGTAVTRHSVLYADEKNTVTLPETEGENSAFNVIWQHGDREQRATLSSAQTGPTRQILSSRFGDFLLVIRSERDQWFFTLLDLRTGEMPTEGTFSNDHAIGSEFIIRGLTAHPDYGFTVTLAANGRQQQIYRLDPEKALWEMRNVNVSQDVELGFVMRVKDDLWLARRGNLWIQFNMIADVPASP